MGKLPRLPKWSRDENLWNARSILESTHAAVGAFFQAFTDTRKLRKAQGTPTNSEQDLLRAGLVFSAAGLDSMTKQLVRDALPIVIDNDKNAFHRFRQHTQKKIGKLQAGELITIDANFLSQAITSRDPREAMIKALIDDLCADSLQSKDKLLGVASHFAIQASDICNNPGRLQEIFNMRHQIVHEMDIDLEQSNRNRRPRRQQDMLCAASELIKVSVSFFTAVEKQIPVK